MESGDKKKRQRVCGERKREPFLFVPNPLLGRVPVTRPPSRSWNTPEMSRCVGSAADDGGPLLIDAAVQGKEKENGRYRMVFGRLLLQYLTVVEWRVFQRP